MKIWARSLGWARGLLRTDAMSSTRYATDGALHQERYCSTDFERGLLANIVAKRCERITEAADRDLIWFIQGRSHGAGLDKLAAELLRRFPDRVDAGPTGDPSEAAWLARRHRLAEQAARANYLSAIESGSPLPPAHAAATDEEAPRISSAAKDGPKMVEALVDEITRLCVDPAYDLQACGPWCFKTLVPCLREYMVAWTKERQHEVVATRITNQIFEQLDYCWQSGSMVVIEGPSLKVGKSFGAQAWGNAHPGRSRSVEVPSTNDDIGFFRALARSNGSASALSMKGVQLRERVELALRSSKLMLVLDDAHYLWPQSNRRGALPNRLNWLLSALVKHGVPVALITTPQFTSDQQIVERKTGWTSAQFLGEIGAYHRLPGVLSIDELSAIAAHCLPAGDRKSIALLANYALGSGRFLGAIQAAVKRATVLAQGAAVTFAHIEQAITQYVVPSSPGLSAGRPDPSCKPDSRRTAPAPQDGRTVAAAPLSLPARGVQPAGIALETQPTKE